MDAVKIGNMQFDLKPASDYPLPDLVQTLNRGFENYLVPIHLNLSQFLTMVRKDSIDLTASRVLLVDEKPSGIALIARRGSLHCASRLAAMGIATEMRGNGAGSWFMERLIAEARERADHEMLLEVIEQNDAAVRLYKKFGFQSMRRLVGFLRKEAVELEPDHVHEVDVREIGLLIAHYGLPDLPWQLTGETISQMTPPTRAYCKDKAYIVISNPEAEHIVIWSLLVEPNARGNNLGVKLLRTVMANHRQKTWHIPAIYPQELGKVFERAGFEREELSQWQMNLPLLSAASPPPGTAA